MSLSKSEAVDKVVEFPLLVDSYTAAGVVSDLIDALFVGVGEQDIVDLYCN